MKAIRLFWILLCLLVGTIAVGFASTESSNQTASQRLPTPSEVEEVMNRVNDYWQVNFSSTSNPWNKKWNHAVYSAGNMAHYQVTGNASYLNYALDWAEGPPGHEWELWQWYENCNAADNCFGCETTFADNQCAGQTYLALKNHVPDEVDLSCLKQSIDESIDQESNPDWPDWSWIDALYMAMPIYSELCALYGDPYCTEIYQGYNDTKEQRGLYYEYVEDGVVKGLWYRDEQKKYPDKKTCNGKREFWSRGNGWVLAALARVLSTLPQEDSNRQDYVDTFVAMAKALKDRQRTDGFWNVSLDDADDPCLDPGETNRETSGTVLFTYGLAWGINNGILPPTEFEATVAMAWNALVTTAIQPNGKVAYCQPAGHKPVKPPQTVAESEDTDFCVGGFLLAGSEMYNLTAGKIAFTSLRDGNHEIYLMNADGSNPLNLTKNPAYEGDPAWSPAGDRIAFFSNRDGNPGIYVMDQDGSNPWRLTEHANDGGPTWSADGAKIAFHRGWGIYVVDVMPNSMPERLAAGIHPDWSPDSKWIAFNGIYKIDPEGIGPPIKMGTLDGGTLDWSPDGSEIAFVSGDEDAAEIYVMNAADGGAPRNLTNNMKGENYPAWSGDGRKILFGSYWPFENHDIYVMNAADGSNRMRLTDDPEVDFQPDWQPQLVDGAIGSTGGTVEDVAGTGAGLSVPDGVLSQDTNVSIGLFAYPSTLTPPGFVGPGTVFVNFVLQPVPGLLPQPGMTIRLPLAAPLAPGLSVPLFKYDPDMGTLIDTGIVGTVDEDGMTATFTGVTDFSIFVGLLRENEPPDCSAAKSSHGHIWPPNHQFRDISVASVSDPDGDVVAITIDGIFQDEPVDSYGDGSFVPDGIGVGTPTAQVRAERTGTGNGRVYHLTFSANDGYGGACSGEVLVSVPHNTKKESFDDGPLYDSTAVMP